MRLKGKFRVFLGKWQNKMKEAGENQGDTATSLERLAQRITWGTASKESWCLSVAAEQVVCRDTGVHKLDIASVIHWPLSS